MTSGRQRQPPGVAAFRARLGRRRPRDRFEALMQPHVNALYGAARRMTLSAHDAEDLLQEVYILAFDRLAEFEEMEFNGPFMRGEQCDANTGISHGDHFGLA